MRLLYTRDDGRLGWTKDMTKDIPPYAILSHTWGGQEVTLNDLRDYSNVEEVDAMFKEGYRKIFFCAQQARRDNLEYFWVDTCCIDRTNNVELSEAINSMFFWYQNAQKCYVYLSDVNRSESDLRKSRWFTRGWTLQELLAPHSVEFYSRDGARLGTKESLKHIIHNITKIPDDALSGTQLSEFTVRERFSWAGKRQTTRGEDKAYCLFGIFGVYLSPIYGEGEKNAIRRLKKEVGMSEEKLDKVCSLLSAPDPSTNYHKALKLRQPETGLWLLHSGLFEEWKRRAASRLWLYGIPGCGKTILSSTIVENLLQHCQEDLMVTVYFYFDFNDARKQDPELMLRSLLCQLLQRSAMVPKCLDALLSNGQRQPSAHELLEAIHQAAREFTQVYIVLDALDECTQRQELMDVLESVAKSQLNNVHLLLTSRKERDIESSLENYVEANNTVCLERDVVDKDIQLYVQQRLRDEKSLVKWNQDAAVRQEIEHALMRGAHGMFRWAVCQLDTLAKCRNLAMLRKSLATLPRTLDQTYERILSAISEDDCAYAIRILQWLTFSARPLTVEEVAEVVAIDVEREPAFDRDEVLADPLEALEICSSLVTITTVKGTLDKPTRQIIALAHYSVQEYLVSERIIQGPVKQYSMQDAKCHSVIARGCLKYLMQFQQPFTDELLVERVLARYTAKFWSNHIQKTGDEIEQVNRLVMCLMAVEEPAYVNWLRLYNPDRYWEETNLNKSLDTTPTPLYCAAILGLETITRLLLSNGAKVNAQGGLYSNALQAASSRGNEQIVQILLKNGAEVNAQGGSYGNALQAASFHGTEQIVQILLKNGAEVNAQGGYHGNALQAASSRGNEQIVQILLKNGAEVNAQGGSYGNALHAASFYGNEQIVQILLNNGAEVKAQGGKPYGNALEAASAEGYEQIVKLLLLAVADVNAQGKFGSALEVASEYGHQQIVKLLLQAGVDVNARGNNRSALEAASENGYEQIVKLLLHAGADVNARGKDLEAH
ncbi:hypothetical protein FB567DRAFT_188329 [Paraphoma chrysanthemicola]|uniref:NACHT domain-containing protein n=1 Tax=Paraphoma chrysanthemicola TaxID=798071 RepID=A0A8K0VU27_9PLEO|nr:hypothetical protein FB567DRAFT_188329 [Paraphoma chrysanthemicola]